MKILVVSQYFWPENFRVNDLCIEMIAKGHSVTVLTGEPNYPSGLKDNNYLSNKIKFANYYGCRIARVPIVARGEGKFRLILNYLSYFVMASTLGLWKIRKERFDVVFVCQLSPVTSALPAILYRKIFGTPIVMWVLDLWPDSLKAVGIIRSERILRVINKLVNFIYNRCDLILGQSKSFVSEIRRNSSNPVVEYFPNWAENIFDENCYEESNELLGSNNFNFVFAGNIGEAQDFPNLLNALCLLRDRGVSCRFHIVGDGRYYETLKTKIMELDLAEYVKLWGRYPLDDMPKFFSSADALFVSLKDSPTFSMTIPGKVQSYMMAEKPMLASLSGEGYNVISQSKGGFVSKPGDYESLANNIEAVMKLSPDELQILGINAKNYALIHFNRDVLMSRLVARFEMLIAGNLGGVN